MLTLEFPNISHKERYQDMIAEWGNVEKIPTDPDCLFSGNSYEEFLQITRDNQNNPPEGRVPATLFFIMDDEKLIGGIDLRHHIDHDFLREIGWHVGYGIRPSERKKWYASRALDLLLEEAKNRNIQKLLLTCNDENLWSRKVIENNGGVFERYTEHDGKKVRRYWIEL